MNLKKCFIF